MTDTEQPEMAGSGEQEHGCEGPRSHNEEISRDTLAGNVPVKKHKRAHSRNKSISGRQDFLDEIANGGSGEKCEDGDDFKEKDNLLPPVLAQDADTADSARVKQPRDETDALPASLRYNAFDFLCTLISMLTYVADVAMDCVVAYYFYHLAVEHGIYHYWYFGLTLVFIVLPSLTMTGFSFRWYLMDSDNPGLPAVGPLRWLVRLTVLLLQLAPVLRYLDSMRYGLASRAAAARERRAETEEERARWRRERVAAYTLMVYEDADATLLRLFESFMESAPQLVLQLYILLKDPHASRIYPHQPTAAELGEGLGAELGPIAGVDPMLKLSILVLSVSSSLVSLAWSLVVYHRSLRYTYPTKQNITLLGTVFQFLWHFCSITARVLALSLFASVLPQWIGPLCAAHWLVMASWIVSQRTAACNTQCEEFLFALVLGVIYIFMFFNAKEGRTRYKYLLYYSFCLLENTAIICIWFLAPTTNRAAWYVFPAMTGHYLAFFAGLFFMICYYLWFHPTGGVELSLSCLPRPPASLPARQDGQPQEMRVLLGRGREGAGRLVGAVSSPELKETEQAGEQAGQLARFLSLHSDKVAVRRFSSLPGAGSVVEQSNTPPDPWADRRKLKYMGHKSQEA